MIYRLGKDSCVLYRYEIDTRIENITKEINKQESDFTKACLRAYLSKKIKDYQLERLKHD
jgi:hypothetical protein